MTTVEIILAAIQAMPQALTEVEALYNAVKGDLSLTDQDAIDAALVAAIKSDADKTVAANTALTQAEGE